MPRKFEGPVDQQLLRQFLIPALRVVAQKLRSPDEGRAWPGRAKAVEISADWLEDLLAREAESRVAALRAKYASRRRSPKPLTDIDAEEWLDAMEREADSYRCGNCNTDIIPGDAVGAGVRGIVHKECPAV